MEQIENKLENCFKGKEKLLPSAMNKWKPCAFNYLQTDFMDIKYK